MQSNSSSNSTCPEQYDFSDNAFNCCKVACASSAVCPQWPSLPSLLLHFVHALVAGQALHQWPASFVKKFAFQVVQTAGSHLVSGFRPAMPIWKWQSVAQLDKSIPAKPSSCRPQALCPRHCFSKCEAWPAEIEFSPCNSADAAWRSVKGDSWHSQTSSSIPACWLECSCFYQLSQLRCIFFSSPGLSVFDLAASQALILSSAPSVSMFVALSLQFALLLALQAKTGTSPQKALLLQFLFTVMLHSLSSGWHWAKIACLAKALVI